MNKDGSDQQRLTNTPLSESDPSFSPDGEKILFHSERTGTKQIFIMDCDGSDQINLTKTAVPENSGRWSPGGDKIAFTSVRDNYSQIYLMNPDGSDQERMVFTETNVSYPRWSEDGNIIVCHSFNLFKNIREELRISIANRSVESFFSDNIKDVTFLDWSEDQSRIRYSQEKANLFTDALFEVYLTDSEYKKPERIFKSDESILSARLSPQEDKVLIATHEKVYVLFLDTGKTVKVGKSNFSPAWSPDGKSIVMVSAPQMNIFTVSPDGKKLTKLTFDK